MSNDALLWNAPTTATEEAPPSGAHVVDAEERQAG
jgi:hypothetical protein